MKRCVLIGNASIKDYEKVKKYFKEDDRFVYCDGGLKHMEGLGVEPDLIVGDFDSFVNPEMDKETIVLPREKDDTDTCYALKVCLNRGFDDFLFVGCLGDRLDHTFANIYLLVMLKEKGIKGLMIDDHSEITLIISQEEISDEYSYFSLVSLSGYCDHITAENAKYPLNDGRIDCEYQYGVSNEVIKGKTAKVSVKEGNLLLIKDF